MDITRLTEIVRGKQVTARIDFNSVLVEFFLVPHRSSIGSVMYWWWYERTYTTPYTTPQYITRPP